MDISPEQAKKVSEWVRAGEDLATIQQRIKEEFALSLTYMDVRFLVDDLDLELQDVPEKTQDKDATANESKATDGDAEPQGDQVEDLEPMNAGLGDVSVEVDAIQRPGAVVSGSVTFSDGESAGWQIDQLGRLGIIPSRDGYRPPEQDMEIFQMKLQEALQQKGF